MELKLLRHVAELSESHQPDRPITPVRKHAEHVRGNHKGREVTSIVLSSR